MDKIKKYLSDAILVACFTLFSYFIFLAYERGYLAAFGINSNGLVPLQIQSIVPVVISILFLSGSLFAMVAGVMYVSQWLLKGTSQRAHRIGERVASAGLFIILAMPVENFFWSTNKIALVIFIVGFVFELVIVSILSQKSHRNTFFKRFNLNDPATRNVITVIGMALILLPTYAFCFGFTDAQSNTSFEEIVDRGVHYVVVRQYSDRMILAQVSGNTVLPSYKVSYLGGDGSISFQDVKFKHLSFDRVKDYSDSLTPLMFLGP